MLKGTDLHVWNLDPMAKNQFVVRKETKYVLDRMLYIYAAKRYLFNKCQVKCGYLMGEVDVFGKDFFSDEEKANWLLDCYNARVQAHFSPGEIVRYGIVIKMDYLKKHYSRFQKLNPLNKVRDKMNHKFSEEEQDEIMQTIIERSKTNKFDKFGF